MNQLYILYRIERTNKPALYTLQNRKTNKLALFTLQNRKTNKLALCTLQNRKTNKLALTMHILSFSLIINYLVDRYIDRKKDRQINILKYSLYINHSVIIYSYHHFSSHLQKQHSSEVSPLSLDDHSHQPGVGEQILVNYNITH